MNTRLPVFDVGAWAYDWLTAQALWREQIARLLDHLPADHGPLRVLDLGCGPGVSSFVLAERLGPQSHIVGIDNARLMIGRARRWHDRAYSHLPNIEFHVADATAMDFDDDSFDLAVGHSFLYLVPDRLGVLREMRRVLRPNGAVILMEPRREGSIVAAGRHAWSERNLAAGRWYQAFRFALSMVLWRVASAAAGRLNVSLVEQLFADGGFESIRCHHTLGGLGLHCVSAPEGARPAQSLPALEV